MACGCREGDAVARIESSLQAWQAVQQAVQRGIAQSDSDAAARRLVRLGERISCINACLRSAPAVTWPLPLLPSVVVVARCLSMQGDAPLQHLWQESGSKGSLFRAAVRGAFARYLGLHSARGNTLAELCRTLS